VIFGDSRDTQYEGRFSVNRPGLGLLEQQKLRPPRVLTRFHALSAGPTLTEGRSELKRRFDNKEAASSLAELEKQVGLVMEAIKQDPSNKKQVLLAYISNFYETIKERLTKEGSVLSHYVILGDEPIFGGPSVTDEVIGKAREGGAEAVLSVEGFQADHDITDVIYHVSMSAPCMGVLGWVLKVKLGDAKADIVAEMPYLFDSEKTVKTLGELVEDLEEQAKESDPQ